MRAKRATDAQRAAFDSLRTAARGCRLVADAEGWPTIPGRYGQVEYHNGRQLAVYTDRPRLVSKLLAAGCRRHQTGDTEARLLFAASALPVVARVIRARRRRSLSPETARRLGARTAYRARSGAQNTPGAADLALGHPAAGGSRLIRPQTTDQPATARPGTP